MHRNGFDNARFSGHDRFRDHGRFEDRGDRFHRFFIGPVFWPYAFGDYFSYAFWPYDYYDAFWGYGADAILWGALSSYGAYGDDGYAGSLYSGNDGGYAGDIYRGYRRSRGAGRTGTRRGAQQAMRSRTPEELAETCSGFAPGVTDLPLQRIEQIIQPTPEQRAALDDLKAATAKASAILRSSCPAETPITPVARLDAMEQRLTAMEQALQIVREPLERLYVLLSDQQKQKLEAAVRPDTGQRSASSSNVNPAELCSSQAGFANVPADDIAKSVKLSDAQKQLLEKLKQASAKAAEILRASCPENIPDTLDARLDAAQKRIAALIQAVETVRPEAAEFFASLSDEQKAALQAQTQSSRSASNKRARR
jgi:hypothetical protein